MQPKYTIAGLFQSGQLGSADEAALEELVRLRGAFARYVNPSRGWMSPRFGESAPEMPRGLADRPAWQRYTSWRRRWSGLLVTPSPSVPWGLSVAAAIVMLVTEPAGFPELAALAGRTQLEVVELFIRAVRDYGVTVAAHKRRVWDAWDNVDRDLLRLKQRRQRATWAAKKRRYRDRRRRAA